MGLVSREELLKSATALPSVDVPVPELGEGATVRVRVLMGHERDRFDQELSKHKDDLAGLSAVLVAMAAVDESGKRLFSDKDVDTVERLNGIVLNRVYWAAWKLNKFGGDAVEQDAKNSQSEESEDSGSSSREPSLTAA